MPKHLLPQITNRFSTYYYDLVVVVLDVDVRKDYAGNIFKRAAATAKDTTIILCLWISK